MISPRITTETVTMKVYSIPSPSTWKDVSDTLEQIRRDEELHGNTYDDAVIVTAGDGEIRFAFELKGQSF